MLESAWLFVGAIALLVTGVAILTQTEGARLIPNDDALAIVSGTLGFISWGIFAYGSLDVRVVGDAVTYQFSMPSVTIFAVCLALVPGYVALTGPAELIERSVSDPAARDL